jgi:hypothetical protein
VRACAPGAPRWRPTEPQRRWLRGAVSALAVTGTGGAGTMRSAGCDSAELARGPRGGRGPLRAHLLAQLEEFGRREPAPGRRLLAPHFLALRGPVGSHRIPDFAKAHLAHPEKTTGDRQRGCASDGKKARESGKT